MGYMRAKMPICSGVQGGPGFDVLALVEWQVVPHGLHRRMRTPLLQQHGHHGQASVIGLVHEMHDHRELPAFDALF